MENINKARIGGRIVETPELKKTPKGNYVISVKIAVCRANSNYSDFITCVAWNDTARQIAQIADKGKALTVEGSINTRSYTHNGTKRYTTEIAVEKVIGSHSTVTEEDPSFEFLDSSEIPF